jgi:4-amino-4-deoxy-L-arabinose transferase-like glycosyltransferase
MSRVRLFLARLRSHRTVAVLLGLSTTILLGATAPDIGLTWDEPAYIVAAESYAAWFGLLVRDPGYALSARGIQAHWDVNHEHPPLDKVWSGLVWSIARHLLDDLRAHRLGNILLVGALVSLLYLLVARELGLTAGLAACAALLTMPRFFFHAHLAALDVPAAFAVLATVFAFWRTRDWRALRWDLCLGIVWGLAMATKINAIFVPVALLAWTLLFQRRFHLFRRLVLMGLIGIPVFLAVWPWLYHESVPRLLEYILFVTVDHWPIGQFYLDCFHMPPPWHFAFVMTLAVVPLSLTLSYVLGAVRTVRTEALRALGGLLIICALMPLVALTVGQCMVYDNDRLFMPAFPFLAALSGAGLDWLFRGAKGIAHRLSKSVLASAVPFAVAAVAFVPHLVAAGSLYPHLLSYYAASVGGLPGAVRMGLETTYWCETYAEALPYLNAHARPGDVVWVEDWSHDVMFYYQLQGRLDSRLRITWPPYGSSVFRRHGIKGVEATIDKADYVVIQYRQTGFDDEITNWLRRHEPVYRFQHQGIPLLEIYAR